MRVRDLRLKNRGESKETVKAECKIILCSRFFLFFISEQKKTEKEKREKTDLRFSLLEEER